MAAADYMVWDEMKTLITQMNLGLEKKIRAQGSVIKLSDWRMSLIIHMGCHVALRINDLLRLSWEDVMSGGSIGRYLVLKEKKTGKTRKIALHEDIRKHLKMVSRITDTSGYIFSSKDGKPVTARYVNYELGRIKEKYGVKVDSFSTHSFRKTWARHVWEKSGKDPGVFEMMSMALNHSTAKMTRIYLGITENEISNLYLNA